MPTSINEPHTPAFEEVSGAVMPTITALEPATCAIGSDDFDLHVTGEGFGPESIIYFAGYDEPTTLNEDGTLSTGVKPSLWGAPCHRASLCPQRHAALRAGAFEFTAAAAVRTRSARRG